MQNVLFTVPLHHVVPERREIAVEQFVREFNEDGDDAGYLRMTVLTIAQNAAAVLVTSNDMADLDELHGWAPETGILAMWLPVAPAGWVRP